MKHNLETLKKAIFLESFKEIRKELEGLERELREILKDYHPVRYSCDELIKELLGE